MEPKCTCGHTKGWHFSSGGSFRCHGGDNCPCQNYHTDEVASSPEQPPAPERLTDKSYPQVKRSAEEVQAAIKRLQEISTPAPEKKWEARLKEEFYDGDIGEYGSEGLVDKSENGERLIAFIRQLLEEKAVEVEGKKLVKNPNKKIPEDVEAHIIAHNSAIDIAAAILRR